MMIQKQFQVYSIIRAVSLTPQITVSWLLDMAHKAAMIIGWLKTGTSNYYSLL